VQLPFGIGKSRSIVGLDIGSSSVKAVELAVKPKGIELLHFGVAKLPPEAIVQGAFLNAGAITEAIREAIDAGGIKTKNVATAVSGHSVIVKKISLPTMTREELEESIRWEAEQYIPFDINEVNLDFQIIEGGNQEGQMDVLLVAAKKDLIDDYVHVITDAGLRPVVIDVAAFAVENAFEGNYDARSDEVVALVNVGSQTVNINILAKGAPAFTRDISTGGNAFTEEIQKALSVSWEEAERIKIGGGAREESQDVVPHEVEQAVRGVTDTVIGEISRPRPPTAGSRR
jgi:type IV pilus assembly protein PilM